MKVLVMYLSLVRFRIFWKAVHSYFNLSSLQSGIMYPTVSFFIKEVTGYSISLPFNTFGLFMALAFIFGAYVLRMELKRQENNGLLTTYVGKNGKLLHPFEQVNNIVFIGAVFGLIGARLFSIMEYWSDFVTNPIDTLLSTSGLTFYGGLIVGSIAVLIFTRKRGIYTVYLLDAAAPALMLAYGIGRMGCHFAGDGDWGIDNPMPQPGWLQFLPTWAWAYDYPHNVIHAGVAIPGCQGPFCSVLPTPVFPTALYEIVMAFIIFLVLWAIRKRIRPGILFSTYLIFTGLERFLIERIRIDSEYIVWGLHIKQAEIISIILFLCGMLGLIYFSRKTTAIKSDQGRGRIIWLNKR